MYHTIPTAHAQSAVWLMNRTTLAEVRKWKDAQGRYLVIDPQDDAPSQLLGRPVVEMKDMDNIGANKFPVLLGDMAGYRIVDRIGLSILRDPYTLGSRSQVRFVAHTHGLTSKASRLRETAHARTYLTTPSKDLSFVCAMAGIDMDALIDRMKVKVAEAPSPEDLIAAPKKQLPARKTEPKPRPIPMRLREITIDGTTRTIEEWGKRNDLKPKTIANRLASCAQPRPRWPTCARNLSRR